MRGDCPMGMWPVARNPWARTSRVPATHNGRDSARLVTAADCYQSTSDSTCFDMHSQDFGRSGHGS